jgi:hypothetical protein
MNSQKINLRFFTLTAIILIAAFSRLVPHIPNFSPLGAIGLFGAAHFNKKWQAILIPLTATWLSDLFINNVIYGQYYPSFTWLSEGFYWQYGAYVLITIVAFFIFKKVNTKTVITGAFASSIIFFLVTNFGCWPGSTIYPQNFAGLMQCYAAGLPFATGNTLSNLINVPSLFGTLMGNLFYSGILFGAFAYFQKKYTVLMPAKA